MSKQRRIKRAESRRASAGINYSETIAAFNQGIKTAKRNIKDFEAWAKAAGTLSETHPFIITIGDPRMGATGAPVKTKGGRTVAGISYARSASQFSAEGVELFKKSKFTDGNGEPVEVVGVKAPEYYKTRAQREREALERMERNREAAVELKRRQSSELVVDASKARALQDIAKEARIDIYLNGERFDRRKNLARKIEDERKRDSGREVRVYIYQRDIYIFSQPIKKQ